MTEPWNDKDRIFASIKGGHYVTTTAAMTRVIRQNDIANTEELRRTLTERTECDYTGYNVAELIMILSDIEYGSICLEREADAVTAKRQAQQ